MNCRRDVSEFLLVTFQKSIVGLGKATSLGETVTAGTCRGESRWTDEWSHIVERLEPQAVGLEIYSMEGAIFKTQV